MRFEAVNLRFVPCFNLILASAKWLNLRFRLLKPVRLPVGGVDLGVNRWTNALEIPKNRHNKFMMKIASPAPVFSLLGCLLLLATTGCEPGLDPLLDIVDARSSTGKVDDYERAISLVTSAKGFSNEEFENLTAQNLNRWASRVLSTDPTAETSDGWSLDPELVPLFAAHSAVPPIKAVDSLTFQRTDAYYLRQADWCDELVRRLNTPRNHLAFELFHLSSGVELTEDEPEVAFLKALQTLNPDLNGEKLDQLALTLRLFDWVVRNTQLEPATEFNEEERVTEQLVDISTGNPWSDGVRGPGYVRTPYQAVLYGRCDYIERALLFIKLLEHAQLNALMLSVQGKPWAVGVEIGDELYLFDTLMGLPIPNQRFGSVLTLRGLRENPASLRKLDLTRDELLDGENRYWVKESDLDSLKGLIYVAPESVSRRILFLEKRMIGEKLQLVKNLAPIRAVAAKQNNLPVEVWDIGFKNWSFRWALRDALVRSRSDESLQAKLFWYYDNESYADTFETYRTARNMFVHGMFERDPSTDDFNVIENFYLLMYDDKKIDELATNRPLLMRLGILQTVNQSAREFQERIRSVQGQMRLVRRDAGVFLAQSHFDNGNLGTASNWLERLALKEDASRWEETINYLSARAYESRREYDLALAELGQSSGQSKHGNLLRKRFLKQAVEALSLPTSAVEETAEPNPEGAEESSDKAEKDAENATTETGSDKVDGSGDDD